METATGKSGRLSGFLAIRILAIAMGLAAVAQLAWLWVAHPEPASPQSIRGSFLAEMLGAAMFILLCIPMVRSTRRSERIAGAIILAGGIVLAILGMWMAYAHIG